MKCTRCEGEGQIANDEEGAPWSMWADLPPGADAAVRMGLVKPIDCPDCGGTGQMAEPAQAMTDLAGVLSILRFISDHDIHGMLWWRCDGEYAPLTFFVNCSDLFAWGSADLEPLTAATLPVLSQAVADAEAIDPTLGAIHGCSLYACRMRGMRPQAPAYPGAEYAEAYRRLFDACGPERKELDHAD